MTITAEIIADSVSADGHRITSVQLRYPKFIHGEFMTHRVFSRNAASSRAIPVERMIKDVMEDPAMPVYWGKNQKGMQADEEMSVARIKLLRMKWLHGRDEAVNLATTLMQDGLHKQIANRILEPWFHINTIVTSTEWDNFFTLRRHKDAQPEMRVLAEAIMSAMLESQPALTGPDDWHLPYVTDDDIKNHSVSQQRVMSVARCARVSYMTQGGTKPSYDEDLQLYNRLMSTRPKHASPAEHQARPDFTYCGASGELLGRNMGEWRNFKGWRQYRALLD